MQIENPAGLEDLARQFGVTLGTHTNIDPNVVEDLIAGEEFGDVFGEDFFAEIAGEDVVIEGEDEMGSEATFGFSMPWSKVKKKVTVKLAAKVADPKKKAVVLKLNKAPVKVNIKKTATGLATGVAKGAAIASFAVPGVGAITGSAGIAVLAAADKVLSDPRVKNAAKIVKNTQALAALGHPTAQRGAATLAAAAKIRVAAKTPPGQPAIPVRTVAQKQAVAAAVPHTVLKVTPTQVKTLVVAAAKKPGWFDRVLGWFGLAKK